MTGFELIVPFHLPLEHLILYLEISGPVSQFQSARLCRIREDCLVDNVHARSR
jgi:hypothetical protein